MAISTSDSDRQFQASATPRNRGGAAACYIGVRGEVAERPHRKRAGAALEETDTLGVARFALEAERFIEGDAAR